MAVKAKASITVFNVNDGAKGDTGAKGNGVSSVTRYYYLAASKPSKPTTATPPSPWTATEPTYTDGSSYNLYFTDKTLYTDGTWAYGDVQLSSSYAAAKAAYQKAVAAGTKADAAAKTLSDWCSDNDTTLIDGAKIYTGSITAQQLSTDAIMSRNYEKDVAGSKLSLVDGSFDSPGLKWSSAGKIEATEGKIGGWILDEKDGSLYQDVTIDLIKYRVYIQPPQTDSTTDTWVFSTQRFDSSKNGYVGTFRVTIDGRLMISDTFSFTDGSYRYDYLTFKNENVIVGLPTKFTESATFNGYVALMGTLRVSGETNFSGAAYFHKPVAVNARMTFSAHPMLNNNVYILTKTSGGTECSLLGRSSGNNLWLGDYGATGTKQVCSNAYIVASNVYKTTSSGNTSLSDRRYKSDFCDIDGASDFIMALKPRKFKFTDGTSGRYHMGFVAQDTEKTMLDTVGDTGLIVKYTTEEGQEVVLDDESTYIIGIRYEEIIAPLVATVQKQQEEIDELKKRLDALEQALERR